MANQSFSPVHPCDSNFFYSNTMPNDERNNTSPIDLNAETQRRTSRNQSHHLLFDNPVNLYEYQSILPKDSTLVSRSVPSSRRNSRDKNGNSEQPLDSLFNSKLQLETTPSIPDPNIFTNNDNRFTLRSSLTATIQQLSSPTDITGAYSSETNSEGINSVFQQLSHQLTPNPPVHHYQPSSFVPPNDQLFVQKPPMGHDTDLYSIRGKSWTQHHTINNNNGRFLHDTNNYSDRANENYLPADSGMLTTPRRSSYGWQDPLRYQVFSPDLSNIKTTRLTTSQSHSDLRATSIEPTAASFGFYNGSSDGKRDFMTHTDSTLCQQYIQYGYCGLGDQCHSIHPNELPRSTIQQPSKPYPSYPTLFSSSGNLVNNSHMINPSTSNPTSLPIFPVGASSSVYGRGMPSHQHPLYKHPYEQPSSSPRRSSTDQDSSRFTNATLKEFEGHLYEIAKDQNGCRFLQRKLEDATQHNAVQAIYDEIHGHFVELMTNSFGNYLCQKLLERCDVDQRDRIVGIVGPDVVKISLNMHGTRAVQKLIECLSTPDQIRRITSALNPSVVPLIKDLNGNHVIQKCLHRLSAEHRQFIYDAVSDNCMQVATHKHGCCVLQRCVDYASASQKAQLVGEITRHALPLVQDPYGNYVVQYVLEIGNSVFSDGLIRQFVGHTCHLSAQKFSSNVIEKCIRVASPDIRRLLVSEFIDPLAMEKLLRDSFANYVVQTALDYAELDQRTELVACIRPLLSSVKSTPYAKRIHGKIARDQQRLSEQHQTLQQTMYPQQQQRPQNRRSINDYNIPI